MGSVKWTEGGGRSSVTHQGEQIFMNATNYFFGKEGGEPIEVSAGVHLYKFANKVPNKAPASAEGKHGFIRYKVEVNLDIPYMPDLNASEYFTVIRHEDLNNYPELRLQSEVEEVKTFCCFFCESDPLLLKISVPKTGFSIGEKIPVEVEVFNRSSYKFTKSIFTLYRVETFHSYTPLEKSRKNYVITSTLTAEGVEPRKNAKFTECIMVPQNTAISNERLCDVFQISYEIKLTMKTDVLKRNATVEACIPLYIGNIPLRINSTVSIDSSSLPMDDLRGWNNLWGIASFDFFHFSAILQKSRGSAKLSTREVEVHHVERIKTGV